MQRGILTHLPDESLLSRISDTDMKATTVQQLQHSNAMKHSAHVHEMMKGHPAPPLRCLDASNRKAWIQMRIAIRFLFYAGSEYPSSAGPEYPSSAGRSRIRIQYKR